MQFIIILLLTAFEFSTAFCIMNKIKQKLQNNMIVEGDKNFRASSTTFCNSVFLYATAPPSYTKQLHLPFSSHSFAVA